MIKLNIIWGIIFGFLSSVTCFYLISNDDFCQSQNMFKYVGFVDYSEDVVSRVELMKIISEGYKRYPNYGHDEVMVRTPETATKIGMAVLSSKYGVEFVEAQKPFRVYLLNGNVWMLQGYNKGSKILIQKSDASILSIQK